MYNAIQREEEEEVYKKSIKNFIKKEKL